jgi:plasmid maintenance system killer protein
MIQSFADDGTEDLFNGRNSKAARRTLPRQLWQRTQNKLSLLDYAAELSDAGNVPGNRLESLKGSRRGQGQGRWVRFGGCGPGGPEFGAALETWLMHELTAYSDYRSGEPLHHWRSTSGYEVDFIIGDHTAVEVKAKTNVSIRDLRSLRALAEEEELERYICVSLEPLSRIVEGVEVLPYATFLARLWAGETS